ncbi:MAG: AMP-binding protein [Fibrobacter sp.]|nr:AMP-binding protein [Fibrobacter sp.]
MNKSVYADLLNEVIQAHSDKDCFHIKRNDRYTTWKYRDFNNDLNSLTDNLKKHGLKKGTNGIVIGENSPEWVIAYHAILLTGACTVPIDPNIPPTEIESILSITEAKVVFCSRIFINLFRTLKDQYSFLEKIIVLEPDYNDKEPTFKKIVSQGNANKSAFTVNFAPDDPVVIIFTSGTTGKAKGVVLCQKNFTVVTRYGIPRMKLSSVDTVCAVLPLHHVFGFAACIAGPILAGMDVVFVPQLKGPLILEALQDKGVTMLPAVPKMIALFYDSIMHNIKKKGPMVQSMFAGMKTISATVGETLGGGFRRKLFTTVHSSFGGKLKVIVSGGAALNKKYWNGFRQLGFNIVEGYGLTETFGPIALCPLNNQKLGSVGPILGENEIKIADPDASGRGEILLRGNCVFKGYYKNQTLTDEVLDRNGWFRTGDLGYLDKEGFLFINGRKKDVIVLDTGKNVYPDELEDYYGTSPMIEEIGIFGIKQDEGEIVAAAIVPSPEVRKNSSLMQASDMLFEELNRLGKGQPIHRKVSDFVTVFTPLPRTTTKKLKKPELIKLYNSIKRKTNVKGVPEQLSVVEVVLMQTDEFAKVVDCILHVAPKLDRNIITPRSHLEMDLGLESFDKIDLLSCTEKQFKVNIPESIFSRLETVNDLVSFMRDQKFYGIQPAMDRVLSLRDRILGEQIDFPILPKSTILKQVALPVIRGFVSGANKFSAQNVDILHNISSPLIFISNHSNILDAFWILHSIPETLRRETYFIAETNEKYPGIPYSFLGEHIINVEPPNDPIQVVKVSLSIIRNKRNLIVFPEGHISKNSVSGPFKSAVSLLVRETGTTIVPVNVDSLEKSCRVIFGTPFSVPQLLSRNTISRNASPDEISDYLRSVVVGLK